MDLLLGIDVGTTNWKAAAFDVDGSLRSIRRAPNIVHYTPEGLGYYDADEMWAAIAGLIRDVAGEVKETGAIAAVAVTGMAEAVVGIGETGEPTGPIIPWFDTRSIEEADLIRERVGEERAFQITGLECNPIFSMPKILWTKAHQPGVFKKAKKWLPVVDYINFRLSGRAVTECTQASRTMLFDLSTNGWSEEMLQASGLGRDILPELSQSGAPIGGVTRQASLDTGLNEGTPVVMGGHDHLCGSLAAGLLLGRRVLDSSGTAESIVGLSEIGQPLPRTFQGLRVGRHLDSRRYVTWGGIICSGRSVDWAIEQFASLEGWGGSKTDYDAVNARIADSPLGSRGLLYLPHLRGAGAPYWNPRSRGAFVGLRDTHTQGEMLRAVMEGLCMEARLIIEVTEGVFGSTIDTLNTVGGGARSAVWQQIKADVTGREIEIPEVEEATPLGAALLAGIGVGIFRDQMDASKTTYKVRTRYTPNAEHREVYDRLYAVYRTLYPALLEAHTALTDIERGILQ